MALGGARLFQQPRRVFVSKTYESVGAQWLQKLHAFQRLRRVRAIVLKTAMRICFEDRGARGRAIVFKERGTLLF